MRIPLSAGIAVLFLSTSALAQQPLALPMRSQNPAQTRIDTAMCYSYANQHTGVVMARVSQLPEKPKTVKPGAVNPVAVAAPLPSAIAPGSAPDAASAMEASSTPTPGVAADARAAANASSTSADAPMPALPPPEPPMVQYWRSYGECMTDRGYMVR
ncbi:hypothetical protein [Caballeronia sordidicola]|uniref:hypothetical protein n=1 Tax=Caballeronia sordidicola TaxID=196367 RepID=UPI0004D02961|nr:hypothetical protein [Caballeronia sordidicola]